MKRFIFILTAFVAMTFAACETATTETVYDLVAVSIVADADDATRVAVDGKSTTWEVGDKITVAFLGNDTRYTTFTIESEGDISNNGKSAKFWGSVPKGSYETVTAIYPNVEISNEVVLSRTADDNVYMSAQMSNVTIDDNTSLSLAFAHLMHKVDFNLSLASGYTSNHLAAEALTIKMTAKSGDNPIEFIETAYFSVDGNFTSEKTRTSTIEVDVKGKEGATSLSCSTMLFPIPTEKSDVTLAFDIFVGEEKCYEITKQKSALKMSKGKVTTISLELSSDNSFNEMPIELTASKTTIKANGVDSVAFTVKQGNEDVTSKATIYINDGKMMSKSFQTTEPGTYKAYAKVGKKQSETITITAEEVTGSGISTVFAKGVTLSSGWYDVNKKGKGDNGDINMCWCAACSNILQWWQDGYKAAGNTLPAGCPDGPGKKSYPNFGPYELEIMEVFHSDWDNSKGGGWTDRGVVWYFEGRDAYNNISNGATIIDANSGGYFKSVLEDIKSKMYSGYAYGYTGEIHNGAGWIYKEGTWETADIGTISTQFSNRIVEGFKTGMFGLAIVQSPTFQSSGHNVTLWGYEIDNYTGLVTKLYITDSDDLSSALQVYSVTFDDSIKAKIRLCRSGAPDWYPMSLYPVSAYNSAK